MIRDVENTKKLLDRDAVKDAVLGGDVLSRKEIYRAAVDLIEHHDRFIDDIDRAFHWPQEFRCKHEYSKNLLLSLGIAEKNDFVVNKRGSDKFKDVEFMMKPYQREAIIPLGLYDKLSTLYDALYNSEIVGRTIDRDSFEPRNSEMLDFSFQGIVHNRGAEELNKKEGVLLLPTWKLFLQPGDYAKWPLIARDYRLPELMEFYSIFSNKYNREFSPESYGTSVFSKDKSARALQENEVRFVQDKYEDIAAEPHIPVSHMLRSAPPRIYP
jgi:hypothetical protein